MDAHETVLKAYKYFGEADMENLGLIVVRFFKTGHGEINTYPCMHDAH